MCRVLSFCPGDTASPKVQQGEGAARMETVVCSQKKMGRDEFAARYISLYRTHQKLKA